MTPRNLIISTALVLGLLGASALFFPEAWLRSDLSPDASVPIQLFGGALLAFAFLNWTGRGAIYGGIYGRPMVVANFGLGVISGSTAISATMDGRLPSWGWALALLFALQAMGFFWLMRRPPWEIGSPPDSDSDHGSVRQAIAVVRLYDDLGRQWGNTGGLAQTGR